MALVITNGSGQYWGPGWTVKQGAIKYASAADLPETIQFSVFTWGVNAAGESEGCEGVLEAAIAREAEDDIRYFPEDGDAVAWVEEA